jgi:hypothetical protein
MDGFPVSINAPRQQSSVIKWILDPLVSYDDVTLEGLETDTAYECGTVLGQISVGTLSSAAPAAQGTNSAGNGTFSAVTVAAGTAQGDWVMQFLDATHFAILDPNGGDVGHGVAGTAYAGAGPHFTFTAGGTAQAVGDQFMFAISAAANADAGKYVQIDPSATDGSQNFAAVLADRAFIPATTDVDAQALTRDGVVLADALIWPDGMTDDQIAAALAQAASVRITTKLTD